MNETELRIKSVDTALEWTKQIITLSAGILVVSGTFIKDVFGKQIVAGNFLIASWIALCVCILFGILFMGSLCSIFARSKSAEVNLYSQPAQFLGVIHFLSFIVAIVGFAVFALRNLDSSITPTALIVSAPLPTLAATEPTSCLMTLTHLLSSGLNLVAVMISLVALIVALVALSTQRRHNRLAMQPCFSFDPEVDHTNNIYAWKITNFGGGPALIEGVDVTIAGVRTKCPKFGDLIMQLGIQNTSYEGAMLQVGDLFGPGRTHKLLAVNSQQQISPAALSIVWHIRYKTAYEETGEFSTAPLP